MSLSASLRGMASRLLSARPMTMTTTTPFTSTIAATRSTTAPEASSSFLLNSNRLFSTTTPVQKGGPQKKKKGPSLPPRTNKPVRAKSKKGMQAEKDPRMVNLLKHFAVLSPKRIPMPLRMGRNRHLRHWTIHRAWLMFRRQERVKRETTLMRQHASMSAACEELRLTAGPGTRDQGYLYRVAMEKKGVYGNHGFPIEYARPQVETPPKVAWNHDWKS